jgi:hypothetical protein
MSTRPVAPDHIPAGWEEINRITNRLKVPGGYIYEVRNAGIVFVPEPVPAPDAAKSVGAADVGYNAAVGEQFAN